MDGDHGGEAHRILISHARAYLERGGWRIQDPRFYRVMLSLKVPAIPDIVASKDGSYRTTWGKKKSVTESIVVEVETNPTTESVRKKHKQYTENLVGHQLYILDATKIPGWKDGWENITIKAINDWLEGCLP